MSRLTFLAVITLFVMVQGGAADEPSKNKSNGDNQLIGTWKIISAKYGGIEVKREEGVTTIKHVTPTQFMWGLCDKEGNVTDALGGSYTLKGNKYVELPEYGTREVLQMLKGKLQEFTWKVEGNRWYHNGKLSTGLIIEEVWERVERK